MGTWVREAAKLHRQYGPVVRIGPNHLAIDGSIGWPEVYEHNPSKAEFSKYPDFLFANDTISVIGARRDDYRRQRRQLAHAFSDTALVEQEGVITKYIDLLMAQLSKHAIATEPVNIVNWVNFDIIGDLTFAEFFGSLQNSDYHPWVLNFFQAVRGNAMSRLMDFYPLIRPLLPLVLGTKGIRRAKENQAMAISRAKARMALGEEPKGGRRDFMTYMFRKTRNGDKGMTDIEILVNSPVLIGAGSESTATALSGFFFYLGQHPDAYNYLAREVRDAFANEDEITMKSTRSLEYLHACIEETPRIYPPAAEVPPRICPGVDINGTYIPRGTVISVYQWATFRNPDKFVDPDSFHPERWLPETHPRHDAKYANDNRAVFKPFSYGPRDCIGKNLTYSEIRVIISRILFRCNFELEAGQLE